LIPRSATVRSSSKDSREAEADVVHLLVVPCKYLIMFCQPGASLQISMVPMNLLAAGETADYIDTGSWAGKAIQEARKIGNVNVIGSTKSDNYARIPSSPELMPTPGAAYIHLTSNNTIEGTEWKELPPRGVVGDMPLVSDTSSDIFSRPIEVDRHALIYAGPQKPGPGRRRSSSATTCSAGVANGAALPTMLSYARGARVPTARLPSRGNEISPW
jgi:phosphoserine aminotransferase